MKLVFVSHATADKELVEQFVDTILRACGLPEADIFVSSIPGMDIPAGSDLLATVRAEVSDTTLVIAVITPTYPTRPVCIAELGAAWGVAGKLLPVLVPGMSRDRLDGVLTGVKVDYLNEEKALDEIAQRIEAETGRRPASPASWTRAKRKWLHAVAGLVAELPTPEVVSKAQYDELKSKLSANEQALQDAEDEVTELKATVERLKVAKDAAEVADILLPVDDIERFEALRNTAVGALRKVTFAVKEVIRHHLAGERMPWPNPVEEPDLVSGLRDAVSEGFLIDTGNGLMPDMDHGPVERAVQAVSALENALREGNFKPDFYEWFNNKFDGPPRLEQGAIWRNVFF